MYCTSSMSMVYTTRPASVRKSQRVYELAIQLVEKKRVNFIVNENPVLVAGDDHDVYVYATYDTMNDLNG